MSKPRFRCWPVRIVKGTVHAKRENELLSVARAELVGTFDRWTDEVLEPVPPAESFMKRSKLDILGELSRTMMCQWRPRTLRWTTSALSAGPTRREL
jgi:hypothetical protein